MAGKRQHILPQFLLKGFASRIVGKSVFTWVYQEGAKPFEPNIENVSVGNYFYGKEGEFTVDPEITELEREYVPLVNALRLKEDRSEIADPKVAELITHLTLRTKFFREFFRESSEFVLDALFGRLADFNYFKALMLRYINNNPQIISNQLEELIKDYPVPQYIKDLLVLLVQDFSPDFLDTQKPLVEQFFLQRWEQLKESIPKAVKEGHIKVLSEGLVPEPRVEEYRNLKWLVYKSEKLLILGDTACLFETSGARAYKPINDKGDDIKNIFLPISSERMLIGTAHSTVPEFDFNVINEAIAKCSQKFFICSSPSESLNKLHQLIGEEAWIISRAEQEQIINEIIRDMENGAS